MGGARSFFEMQNRYEITFCRIKECVLKTTVLHSNYMQRNLKVCKNLLVPNVFIVILKRGFPGFAPLVRNKKLIGNFLEFERNSNKLAKRIRHQVRGNYGDLDKCVIH